MIECPLAIVHLPLMHILVSSWSCALVFALDESSVYKWKAIVISNCWILPRHLFFEAILIVKKFCDDYSFVNWRHHLSYLTHSITDSLAITYTEAACGLDLDDSVTLRQWGVVNSTCSLLHHRLPISREKHGALETDCGSCLVADWPTDRLTYLDYLSLWLEEEKEQ